MKQTGQHRGRPDTLLGKTVKNLSRSSGLSRRCLDEGVRIEKRQNREVAHIKLVSAHVSRIGTIDAPQHPAWPLAACWLR